jgi:hypothetical protein
MPSCTPRALRFLLFKVPQLEKCLCFIKAAAIRIQNDGKWKQYSKMTRVSISGCMKRKRAKAVAVRARSLGSKRVHLERQPCHKLPVEPPEFEAGSEHSGSQNSGSEHSGSQHSGSEHSGSQHSGSQDSGSQHSDLSQHSGSQKHLGSQQHLGSQHSADSDAEQSCLQRSADRGADQACSQRSLPQPGQSVDPRSILAEHTELLVERGQHQRGRLRNHPDTTSLRTSRRKSASQARSPIVYDSELNSGDENDDAKSCSDQWFDDLRLVPDTFTDPRNDDAAMKTSKERLTSGEVSYRGLHLSHENNEDVRFVYQHMYEAKALRGHSLASYEQFRACIGQFSRFAVVCGLIPLNRVCDAGQLFEAALVMDAVKAFLSYFQLRCAASTVLSKAFHLRTLSKYAERLFCTTSSAEGNQKRAKAALMTD